MNRTALIVSPDYPPTNRSSSLRAYYLAHALVEAGYAVEVFAEAPRADNAGLSRPEGNVKVTRITGYHRTIWLARSLWKVVRMARGRQPGVVLSTSGPFLAHAVGALAKLLMARAFWVADYRDLWASGDYYREQSKIGIAQAFRQWCERRLLQRANLISTVSQGLQENLSQFHGREVLLFHNGYEARSVVAPSRSSLDTTAPIQLCHTGSLYAERSPETLLAAIARARSACPTPLRQLRLLFAGPVDAAVASTLANYGGDDLTYLGTLSRADSYRLQHSCDYCLLLEDPGASLKGVLTGKVFEYIGMRKRIVAVGIEPESELAAILRQTGLLVFCGTGEGALAKFLETLMRGEQPHLADPDEACIAKFERTVISREFAQEIVHRSQPT